MVRHGRESSNKNEGSFKTIQEQEQKYFLFMLAMGKWIPGLDHIFKWPALKPLLRIYSSTPIAFTILNVVNHFYVILTTDLAPFQFLIFFRRGVAFCYSISRMIHHQRSAEQLERIFHTWNSEINSAFFRERRQDYLTAGIKRMKKVALFSALGSVVYTQISNFMFFLDRQTTGSKFVGWPHDPESPNHFYYVLLHYFSYTFAISNIFFCDVINLYVLIMLSAQIACMRESLAEIIDGISIDDENNIVIKDGSSSREDYLRKFRGNLDFWISANFKTIKWATEIKQFEKFESNAKYIFILSYLLLFVFSVPFTVGQQISIDNYVLPAVFAVGNMIVLFLGTRIADDIKMNSQGMFDDAYGKGWYLYPQDVQKTLLLISTVTKKKPITFKTMKVYEDNSSVFLDTLSTAYKALTFLLRMVEDDKK